MLSPERTRIDFSQQYKPAACSVSLSAGTKEECLRELAQLLVDAEQLPKRQVAPLQAAFLERERVASTGVGAGVAIPHVKLGAVKETVLGFGVHKKGVEWSAVDGEPAHIFFVVVRPAAASGLHDPRRHLELMQWIAHLARVQDFRRFALAAQSGKELVELLREMAQA